MESKVVFECYGLCDGHAANAQAANAPDNLSSNNVRNKQAKAPYTVPNDYSTELNLNVRGLTMKIPLALAKKIPFFNKVIADLSKKTDPEEGNNLCDPIFVNTSPDFLTSVIEYMRNNYTIDYLRAELCKKFSHNDTATMCHYLGLDAHSMKSVQKKMVQKKIVQIDSRGIYIQDDRYYGA